MPSSMLPNRNPGTERRKNTVLGELAFYFRTQKKYWLIPMIAILGFFAVLLTISQVAPVISPFIYTLF